MSPFIVQTGIRLLCFRCNQTSNACRFERSKNDWPCPLQAFISFTIRFEWKDHFECFASSWFNVGPTHSMWNIIDFLCLFRFLPFILSVERISARKSVASVAAKHFFFIFFFSFTRHANIQIVWVWLLILTHETGDTASSTFSITYDLNDQSELLQSNRDELNATDGMSTVANLPYEFVPWWAASDSSNDSRSSDDWILNGDRNASNGTNQTCRPTGSSAFVQQYKSWFHIYREWNAFVRLLSKGYQKKCSIGAQCRYRRIDRLLRKCLLQYPEFRGQANSSDSLLEDEREHVPELPSADKQPLNVWVDFELLDISTFSDNQMVISHRINRFCSSYNESYRSDCNGDCISFSFFPSFFFVTVFTPVHFADDSPWTNTMNRCSKCIITWKRFGTRRMSNSTSTLVECALDTFISARDYSDSAAFTIRSSGRPIWSWPTRAKNRHRAPSRSATSSSNFSNAIK